MNVTRIISRVATYLNKIERNEKIPQMKLISLDPFLRNSLQTMVNDFIDTVKGRKFQFITASKLLPESASDIDACLCNSTKNKSKNKNNNIGSGYFGNVYEINKETCAPAFGTNSPKNAHYAVKVVKILSNSWNKLPDSIEIWDNEVKLATLAGTLGVGPKVYKSFLCTRQDETIGILVMDIIRGEKLSEWRKNASEADLLTANTLVKSALQKLHSVGIIHHDLHMGNVLIVPASKKGGVSAVYIVDFGMANLVSDLQQHDLEDLYTLVDGREPADGPLSLRILSALIADKTIRINGHDT